MSDSFDSQLIRSPQFLSLSRRVLVLESELRECECELAAHRMLLESISERLLRPASVGALVRS